MSTDLWDTWESRKIVVAWRTWQCPCCRSKEKAPVWNCAVFDSLHRESVAVFHWQLLHVNMKIAMQPKQDNIKTCSLWTDPIVEVNLVRTKVQPIVLQEFLGDNGDKLLYWSCRVHESARFGVDVSARGKRCQGWHFGRWDGYGEDHSGGTWCYLQLCNTLWPSNKECIRYTVYRYTVV